MTTVASDAPVTPIMQSKRAAEIEAEAEDKATAKKAKTDEVCLCELFQAFSRLRVHIILLRTCTCARANTQTNVFAGMQAVD